MKRFLLHLNDEKKYHLVIPAKRERVSFRGVPTKFWPDNNFYVSLRIMLKLGYTHVDYKLQFRWKQKYNTSLRICKLPKYK